MSKEENICISGFDSIELIHFPQEFQFVLGVQFPKLLLTRHFPLIDLTCFQSWFWSKVEI